MISILLANETASLTGKKYTFQKTLKAKMSLFSAYAENHGKLFALTETGVANEDNKALLETGNERPDWFTEILNIVTDKQYNCCYLCYGPTGQDMEHITLLML